MIAITGATGQLGQLVLEKILTKVPAEQVVALVRNPGKAQALAAQGVVVRQADYNDSASLEAALAGVDKLLLISSSEVGQRLQQHRNVINAAKKAGVKLLAYTSILRADTSSIGLAVEHKATEQLLKESGIAYVLLRNGWYTENYAASIGGAIAAGAFAGSAGEGRIASATRADYAAAAVAVLTQEGHGGKTYELAGDDSYTLAEFAAEISRASGKEVPYHNLPEAEFSQLLETIGLPKPVAELLASSDVSASEGALFDDSHSLSKLIGRPTTPFTDVIKANV